jgi:hypothetical protein
MGVSHMMPEKMASRGVIAMSREEANEERNFAFYDARECDQNFHEYEELVSAGGVRGRPRSKLNSRPVVLRHLAKVKHRIEFSDAITIPQAAEILGVCRSYIPRLVSQGKIVGRVAWADRGESGPKVWIISKRSCLENVREAKKNPTHRRPRSGWLD